MKNICNKRASISILLKCLFYTFNSYSQDYKVNKKEASSEDLAYYNVIDIVFEYKVYFNSNSKKAAFEVVLFIHEAYKEILKFNISKGN